MREFHREAFVAVDGDGRIQTQTQSDVSTALSGLKVAVGSSSIQDGDAPGSLVGNLDGTESFDVIAVSLTAGVTYSFAEIPTAIGGIEDPFLLLFNSNGTLNSYDDDGGLGRSSLLTFTPTTSGTYYLGAASWVNLLSTGGGTGNYTIHVWSSSQPDAPSTTAGAVPIAEGTTFGQISSGTDV